jgi:hypothetical protein
MGAQAAVSYLTTDAGSSEEEQRGHFWPGLVISLLPEMTTCASTMCVQIGQYAQPFVSRRTGVGVLNTVLIFRLPSLIETSNRSAGM